MPERMLKRKVRGKGLRVLLLSAVIVLVVAACGGGGDATAVPADPTATPRPQARPQATAIPATPTPVPATAVPGKTMGGILNLGGGSVSRHVDPHIESGLAGMLMLLYEGLVRRDADGSLAPALAESFDISDDGRVYTFNLRQGVKFHQVAPVNGREVTADDVVWSLSRLATKAPEFPLSYLSSKFITLEAVDKKTVKLTTAEPFAPQIRFLAHHAAMIAAREVEEAKADGLRDLAVGTGTMVLKEVDFGVSFSATAHLSYWDAGLPYFDGVTYAVIPDSANVRAAYRTGRIDVIDLRTPLARTEILKSNPDTQIKDTAGGIYYVKFNTTRKPFDDPRVRYALSLALDRQEASQAITFGQGKPAAFLQYAYGAFNLTEEETMKLPGYRPNKEQDVKEAKRLLAEAGYPDGFTSKCMVYAVRTYPNEAPIIYQQWESIGVKLESEVLPYAQWKPKELASDFNCVYGSNSPRLDPDELLSAHYRTGGSNNVTLFSNAEIDQMLDAQGRETVPEKRAAIIHELILKLHKQSPALWIYENRLVFGAQPWVKGFEIGEAGLFHQYLYRTIWLDK